MFFVTEVFWVRNAVGPNSEVPGNRPETSFKWSERRHKKSGGGSLSFRCGRRGVGASATIASDEC